MKKRPEALPHPLFHSLVIMGGSAAVACGGVASGASGAGPGDPGTGGSGSGGSSGTGGRPGAGGAMETGGATASGGSGGVVIMPCVPAQWSCDQGSEENMACAQPPLEPTTGCTCDETRPLTAEECGPSELFVCRMARRYDPDTGADVETVSFACSCRAVSPDSEGCKAVFSRQYQQDGYDYQTIGPDGGFSALLCGCGWVYLN